MQCLQRTLNSPGNVLLQEVLLQETVDLSRLQQIGGGLVHRMRQANYDRRRPQHLPPPSPSAHPSPNPFSDLGPMSSNPNARRSDLPLDQLPRIANLDGRPSRRGESGEGGEGRAWIRGQRGYDVGWRTTRIQRVSEDNTDTAWIRVHREGGEGGKSGGRRESFATPVLAQTVPPRIQNKPRASVEGVTVPLRYKMS